MTEPRPTAAFYEEMRARLQSVDPARSDRAFWRLATEFEESLLYQEQLPSAAFDFLTYLLTSPETTSRRGLTHFVMVLGSEFHKLTERQKDSILSLLIEHHRDYGDELARHSIADLIARYYPPVVAMNSLRTLNDAGTQQGKHLAFVIADVLARRLPESDPLRPAVLGFLKQAAQVG